MRRAIGTWATLGLPVVAVALLAGCQKSPSAKSGEGSVGAQGAALAGEKAGIGDEIAELCGFKCNTLASGNASISGDAKIDSFFQAVLSLKASTSALDGEVNATLSEMAGVIGAEAGADASITAANIEAALAADGEFGANFESGIELVYEAPKCSVNAQATVDAKARCEGKIDPGSVEVECKGECVAKSDVMLDCGADVEVMCKGTAPSFNCEGECKGTCELSVAGTCEGSCTGTCELTVAGNCDGECSVALDANNKCLGVCTLRAGATCEGQCKGSCELNAAATCEGSCKGECTYTQPSGGCEAGAQASCETSGDVKVKCNGECKGEVTPPKASAECDASVKAEAEFSAECTPPELKLDYTLTAEVEADASAKAKVTAQVTAFVKLYGKLLAKQAKLEGTLRAAVALAPAAGTAISGAATKLTSSADAKAVFKGGCALGEIDGAVEIIGDAKTELDGTASAITKVTAAVKG